MIEERLYLSSHILQNHLDTARSLRWAEFVNFVLS